VDKKSQKIICTDLSNGKRNDYRLLKEPGVKITEKIAALTDTGYL
jgi:hypothetical protein